MKTLFIINPYAAVGRARKEWVKIEPTLREMLTDYTVVMTEAPQDVQKAIVESIANGVTRIISVGGDGTNNAMVNAIMREKERAPQLDIIYGAVPAGTGRDWARGVGIPLDTSKALLHILSASPQAVDLGLVRFQNFQSYFLNISSAGISRDVANRVESSAKHLPFAFFRAVVGSLMHYEPEAMRIELDGEFWYEGRIYIAAIANGRSFAQGMLVAPDASVNDGLFDVVIAEEMSTWSLMQAVPTLYTGQHVTNPKVKIARAKHVRITSPKQALIGMDLDGEPVQAASDILFEIRPKALTMLL